MDCKIEKHSTWKLRSAETNVYTADAETKNYRFATSKRETKRLEKEDEQVCNFIHVQTSMVCNIGWTSFTEFAFEFLHSSIGKRQKTQSSKEWAYSTDFN